MSDFGLALESVRARFDAKWIPEPMTGCWLWMGTVGERGYGQFRVGPRVLKATRVSMALAGMEIPKGLFACHRCDQPSCVNPAHLYAGSGFQNMGDMVRRGRHRTLRGSASPHARLTEGQVLEILRAIAAGSTSRPLAAAYGVNPKTIDNIRFGRKWKHVTLSEGAI